MASLAKSNTEILNALGCTQEIVAATSYDAGKYDNVNFEVVGSYIDIDVPKVAALKPDVAFTSTSLQAKYAKPLQDFGIEVVHLDPLSVEDIMHDILVIGKVVSKEDEAKEIVLGMKKENNYS